MEKQATCAERLAGHLESRAATFRALFSVLDADSIEDIDDETLSEVTGYYDPEITRVEDEDSVMIAGQTYDLDGLREEVYQRLNELPLAVSVQRVLRVDLSTGGPQDYFTVELDDPEDGGGIGGTPEYHFLDWFDGARGRTHDPAVERALEYYAEMIV